MSPAGLSCEGRAVPSQLGHAGRKGVRRVSRKRTTPHLRSLFQEELPARKKTSIKWHCVLNREMHEDIFLLHGHKLHLAEEKLRGDLSPSLQSRRLSWPGTAPVPAPALAGANPELASGARTHQNSPSPSESTAGLPVRLATVARSVATAEERG